MDIIITSICRKTIEKCLPSFLDNVKYAGHFRFLVNIDVKNPKYLTRLLCFLDKHSINNITINMNPKKKLHGLTQTINNLYKKITSKYYFNLQDDWIFLEKIDLDSITAIMNNEPEIDHIRLNKNVIEQDTWLYHLSDEKNKLKKRNHKLSIDGVNLVKIFTWSFNPSLCRTETIKRLLPVPNNVRAETYFCHKYEELFATRGAFFLGNIGDKARVKDIGRNIYREIFRGYKHKIINNFKNNSS